MPNTKISALTSATTPLAGTEVLPIVQSSTTTKVAVNDMLSVTSWTSPAVDSNGNMFLRATDAFATGVGTQIGLGGKYNTTSYYPFGAISGRKENATGNNVAGYLDLLTTTSGGSLTARMRFNSTGDGTLLNGNFVVGTSGNGLTSTGTITVKSSSGGTNWQVFSSASATNPAFFINGSGTVNGIGTGANGAASAMYVNRDTGSLRSINAAGSINALGADYAEYMVKDGDFIIAKGDICGIKANGKLTNVFSDAVSFVVKSTDPSYVGGDTWFNEQPPQPPIEPTAPIEPMPLIETEETTDEQKNQHQKILVNYQTTLTQYQIDLPQYQSDLAIYNADLASWKQRLEAARSPVDRIAFCGQVPVNVQGAIAGQYIIPIDDNGAIKGQAISDPTFEQYKNAIGKVIAIEADGRAKIIVKIS